MGTGRLVRVGMLAALAALSGVVAFGALAGAKKKPRKMPRGPYPALGCPVFPASSAAPNAPSAADQTAWNQDVSQAPPAPDSAAVIAHITAHGRDTLHPDFGSPRAYGFPTRSPASARSARGFASPRTARSPTAVPIASR